MAAWLPSCSCGPICSAVCSPQRRPSCQPKRLNSKRSSRRLLIILGSSCFAARTPISGVCDLPGDYVSRLKKCVGQAFQPVNRSWRQQQAGLESRSHICPALFNWLLVLCQPSNDGYGLIGCHGQAKRRHAPPVSRDMPVPSAWPPINRGMTEH